MIEKEKRFLSFLRKNSASQRLKVNLEKILYSQIYPKAEEHLPVKKE